MLLCGTCYISPGAGIIGRLPAGGTLQQQQQQQWLPVSARRCAALRGGVMFLWLFSERLRRSSTCLLILCQQSVSRSSQHRTCTWVGGDWFVRRRLAAGCSTVGVDISTPAVPWLRHICPHPYIAVVFCGYEITPSTSR